MSGQVAHATPDRRLRRIGIFTCCLHFVLERGLGNLTENDLRDMLTYANAAASIITTRKGALRVMPSAAEVEKLMNA